MGKMQLEGGFEVTMRVDAVLCVNGADEPVPYPGVKPVPVRIRVRQSGPESMQVDLIDDVGVKFTRTERARNFCIGLFKKGRAVGRYRFKDDFPDLVVRRDETITAAGTMGAA